MTEGPARLSMRLLACALLGLGLGTPTPAASQTAASTATATSKASVSYSSWMALDNRQKQALAPLEKTWPHLTAPQRDKWLTLSRTFESLSPEEKANVHARMTDWAALSPQERARARLNYSHLQALSREERKAQWEAYQALSEGEKQRLQRRHVVPNSAAPASRPSPARTDRLITPTSRVQPSSQAMPPLDKKTLLPLTGARAGANPVHATIPPAPSNVHDSLPVQEPTAVSPASAPAE